jgi:hypothetical protein
MRYISEYVMFYNTVLTIQANIENGWLLRIQYIIHMNTNTNNKATTIGCTHNECGKNKTYKCHNKWGQYQHMKVR